MRVGVADICILGEGVILTNSSYVPSCNLFSWHGTTCAYINENVYFSEKKKNKKVLFFFCFEVFVFLSTYSIMLQQ